MKKLVFDIETDDIFDCSPLFTEKVVEDESLIEGYLINNLNEIAETFESFKHRADYLRGVIAQFVGAYFDGGTSFQHNLEDGVWWKKQDGKFYWSFKVSYGDSNDLYINVRIEDIG